MADLGKCSRCGNNAETKTRGEKFCADCYITFLSKKVRAEMSAFRVNGPGSDGTDSIPQLLVFVSFGASSLALVDLLLDMQEAQRLKTRNLTGFGLKCVHVTEKEDTNFGNGWPWENVPLKIMKSPSVEDFGRLTRSSSQDLEAILRRDLAKKLALAENGIAVLGYSMTKLSELTLSETVKGRGAGIPKLLSPDLVQDRTIYPLRDVTLLELKEYTRLRGLEKYVRPDTAVPGIIKMQSVDEITKEYFAGVQDKFPSVISTVSKVASRLSQDAEKCGLCQQDDTVDLCYACRSSFGTPELKKKLNILAEYEL